MTRISRIRCFGVILLAVAALGSQVAAAQAVDSGKPKVAIKGAQQQFAEHIALKLSDVGPGWRAEKKEDNNSSSSCFGTDLSRLTLNGRAESHNFIRGDVTFASSLVGVFATANQARAAFAAIGAYIDCFKRAIDDEKQISDVSAGPLGFPRLGERSTAYQIAARYKKGSYPLRSSSTSSSFSDRRPSRSCSSQTR